MHCRYTHRHPRLLGTLCHWRAWSIYTGGQRELSIPGILDESHQKLWYIKYNLPTCLFLHSWQCMSARLTFPKDTRAPSIGFTKKECLLSRPKRNVVRPRWLKRERESYLSVFWLVRLTMHVFVSIRTNICHSCSSKKIIPQRHNNRVNKSFRYLFLS